ERLVQRTMPSFVYDGMAELEGVEHVPAIFFRLPIGKMAEFYVYGSEDGATEQDALDELAKMDQELQRVKFVPWNEAI
ncbi:hypothetical protein P7A58_15360, partial [Clostridium perfringens]|nr:hypothetical protein [Clostridium perfringens]